MRQHGNWVAVPTITQSGWSGRTVQATVAPLKPVTVDSLVLDPVIVTSFDGYRGYGNSLELLGCGFKPQVNLMAVRFTLSYEVSAKEAKTVTKSVRQVKL